MTGKVLIRITRIHGYDAWFTNRKQVIGLIGYASNIENVANGWYSFDFESRDGSIEECFAFADFDILR